MPCPTDNTLKERFWKHVDKNGPIPASCPELGPCWIWTGSKNQDGYGQIGTSKGLRVVHRVSWELHGNTIPEGHELFHHCDQPNCIRPTHLFTGTRQDNMQDMLKKGRQHFPAGDEHYPTRLKFEQVCEIRKLWESGVPQTELAKRFNRKPNTISKIVNRKRWRT
jgi:hypothetical protein